jgi:acetyl esterase/lipase
MIPQPLTGETIEAFCKKRKRLHKVESLPHGAKLHWIGPQPSQGHRVLLFLHGGGYKLSASPAHTPFAEKCASNASASLAMLEYTLAKEPNASYPMQLKQTIEALKHILTITLPSRIHYCW